MDKPEIFLYSITVHADDIDELKHVNNVVYFKFLQEAALAHWYASVSKEISKSMRWVAKKHTIEYMKPAFEGDQLIVKTWIEKMEGVSSFRQYEIYKNNCMIVNASTIWVALDAHTMKPKRLPLELTQNFTKK